MQVSEIEERGSKTLLAGEPMKQPSWMVWTLMKGFRIVLLTALWTGLGMGAGLFCGIVGVVAGSALLHRAPEMNVAYRRVSIPIAIFCGSGALLWNLASAWQAARRRKGL